MVVLLVTLIAAGFLIATTIAAVILVVIRKHNDEKSRLIKKNELAVKRIPNEVDIGVVTVHEQNPPILKISTDTRWQDVKMSVMETDKFEDVPIENEAKIQLPLADEKTSLLQRGDLTFASLNLKENIPCNQTDVEVHFCENNELHSPPELPLDSLKTNLNDPPMNLYPKKEILSLAPILLSDELNEKVSRFDQNIGKLRSFSNEVHKAYVVQGGESPSTSASTSFPNKESDGSLSSDQDENMVEMTDLNADMQQDYNIEAGSITIEISPSESTPTLSERNDSPNEWCQAKNNSLQEEHSRLMFAKLETLTPLTEEEHKRSRVVESQTLYSCDDSENSSLNFYSLSNNNEDADDTEDNTHFCQTTKDCTVAVAAIAYSVSESIETHYITSIQTTEGTSLEQIQHFTEGLSNNLVSQSFCSESYQDNDVSSSFTKCRSKKIFDNDLTLSPLRSFMDSGKDQLQDYLLDSSLKKDASTTSSEQTNTDVENYQDKVEATVKDCMILKQDLEHFISNKNQSLQREESMKTPEGIKSHLSDFIRGDLESYQDVVRKLKETPVHFNQKRSRSLVSNAVSKFRHSLKHKRSSSVAIENPYKKNSKSIIKKRFLYKRKL